MSDIKIVCLARRGAVDSQTASVEVLPADECVIRFFGDKCIVYWSRGENHTTAVSSIDDPLHVKDVGEAVELAKSIRDRLARGGELSAEVGDK